MAWNKKIDSFLVKKSSTKCVLEYLVYVNDVDKGSRVILCLYMDDLVIIVAEEA